MALILQQNILGEPVSDPVALDRRRRRLSTVVKRYANLRRPFIVNVRKVTEPDALDEENDKLRREWVHTLVGPEDVVAIVYLPLGGSAKASAGDAAGTKSPGKQIGSALSMVALAVAATVLLGPAGPIFGAMAGTLGTFGTAAVSAIASAAVVAGGGYLIQRAFASSANKPGAQDTPDRPLYGVSGGGNAPRPGDRIPRGYGQFWTNPDLSQQDFFVYSGEDQILYRRVTVGLGYYRIKEIQIGRATLWTEADGISPLFTGSQIEIIPPGGGSALVPQSVYSAGEVGGNELPRPSETPNTFGPIPGTPPGITASEFQIDFTLNEGCWAELKSNSGATIQSTSQWVINVWAAPCDDDDNATGGFAVVYSEVSPPTQSTRAIRATRIFSLPEGRYLFTIQNGLDASPSNHNSIVLDGLRAYLSATTVRPHVTEIALKITSGKSLGVTSFGEIIVQASAQIPVRIGSTWTLTETNKAAWAYADILRGTVGGIVYGANLPDSAIDIGMIDHYAASVGPFDVFNGVIRGPVSVFEAGQTVLGAMRAEPTRLGNAWSIARDESKNVRKHLFTRRQIMRGSTQASFRVGGGDGGSDVIAEYFFGGDPRRRREVRQTFGTSTTTPRRINLVGVTDHAHAVHIATWMAASNYFRRQVRKLTTEMSGRLVKRNDPAFVDAWFLTDAKVAGVVSRTGNTLTLDTDIEANTDLRVVLRDRQNLDFGPIDFTQGSSPRVIVLNNTDIAALEDLSGLLFQDVFATDAEDMTPVFVGTLTEVREPYIIQSAQPKGRDTVAIEALHDHPSVWEALGEVAIDPGVSAVGDEDADIPTIAYIYAHTIQHSAATSMEWVVGRVKNAAQIVVDMSYDEWNTSERVSEGLATSGNYPLRVPPEDVDLGQAYVRAYAINQYGVPGAYVNGTFTYWRPYITSEFASLVIRLQDLAEGVRRDIEQISKIGEATLRDAVRDLDKKVNALAAHVATEAGRTYESDNVVKVALEGQVETAFSAVQRESELRISETEGLARTAETLAVRLNGAEASILTEHKARISADGAEAISREILRAEHTTTRAMVVNETTVRADADSALAQDVQVVSTTVEGHTLTITETSQSLNGNSGFWGVAVTADGEAVGGIRLAGIRNLDGSYYSEFGILGDLVVTGTISGSKLQTENIISVSAQIGNLIVDNLHVKNQAVTQTVTAAGSSGSASVSVTSRGTGNWIIWIYYYGAAGTYVPLGSATGTLALLVDGSQVDAIGLNYEASGANNSSGFSRLQTTLITSANLGAGTHTLAATCDIGGAVRIVTTEASK